MSTLSLGHSLKQCTLKQVTHVLLGEMDRFVIRDDTNKSPFSRDVGASGHGLGYQGFHHSLAVEFDTWHNSVCGDPYEQHIALHASGSDPNSAHHDTCLGYTIDIPNFADGKFTT